MKTTRPIFTDAPVTIQTTQLLFQSIQATDLDDYHEMRTDPQTMLQSMAGVVDADKEATLEYIRRFLPPHNLQKLALSVFELTPTNTLHDAHTLTNEADANNAGTTGRRFVGTVNVRVSGTPEVGYRILREDWGKGYATEALHAVLSYHWTLDRKVAEVEDVWPELRPYQTHESDGSIREGLIAMLAKSNTGSRVLEKVGFRLVEGKEVQREPDHRGPETLIARRYLNIPCPAP